MNIHGIYEVMRAAVLAENGFGPAVQAERVRLGLSQTALAASMGISSGMLSGLENARKRWTLIRAADAIRALDEQATAKQMLVGG